MPNNTKANRRYGRPPYAAVCLLESGEIRGNMLTRRFAFVPPLYREYSNASEPPFYRLRATSDFNTLEPPQTQDIVMEP